MGSRGCQGKAPSLPGLWGDVPGWPGAGAALGTAWGVLGTPGAGRGSELTLGGGRVLSAGNVWGGELRVGWGRRPGGAGQPHTQDFPPHSAHSEDPHARATHTGWSAQQPPSYQFRPECGAPGHWVLLSEPVELGRGGPQAAWARAAGWAPGEGQAGPLPGPTARAQTQAVWPDSPSVVSASAFYVQLGGAQEAFLGGCGGQGLRSPRFPPQGPCLCGSPPLRGGKGSCRGQGPRRQ